MVYPDFGNYVIKDNPVRDHAAILYARQKYNLQMFSGHDFDIVYDAFRAGAQFQQQNAWISVDDDLPPYGEVVLVTVFELGRRGPWWLTKREKGKYITKDEHDFLINRYNEQATHWMRPA